MATTSNFSLGNPAKESKPVEIPKDINWTKPDVLVQARPSVASLSTSTKPQSATAIFVGDGDGASFNLKDGSKVNCRVYGIDAPETAKPDKPGQPYGEDAKNLLKEKILNKEVTVTITQPVTNPDAKATPQNNYNRALCKISIEGADVSTAMVKEGAAWVYDYFVRNKPEEAELRAAQTEAKSKGRGLWGTANPVYPPTFKQGLKSNSLFNR